MLDSPAVWDTSRTISLQLLQFHPFYHILAILISSEISYTLNKDAMREEKQK